MTPYYEQSGVSIYHGDCREILPTLPIADVVITDPPYDRETHAGARTLDKGTRARASSGRTEIVSVAPMEIDFSALVDVEQTASLYMLAKRWCLVFCSLEMLGDYRTAAGDAYVRSGFWRRPDGTPQTTGDRPAQPGEGIAILHRAGRKRWHGGGHHAFYEHCTVKHGRVHPTQKPESLMCELVSLYSDRGETILDPYMGSGTTLVAAKRLGRKAIGAELDERYCETAAKRLQQEALPLEFDL